MFDIELDHWRTMHNNTGVFIGRICTSVQCSRMKILVAETKFEGSEGKGWGSKL